MPEYPDHIEFEVTKEDIEHGGHTAFSCPISRAVERSIGKYCGVGWYHADVYFGDTKVVTKAYSKPVAVSYSHNYMAWLRKFDTYLEVRPFRGVLEREHR